ncbi:MAG: type VI secretion system tube protein TssD [Pseudomonadota bacterium]
MPRPAYLSIEGQFDTKGALSEDSVSGRANDKHVDECLIISVQHQVIVPTDPDSGLPSGKRRHGNLVLTKVFDSVSPSLYQALCENQDFNATLSFDRVNPSNGQEEIYFEIELSNARVVNMEIDVPSTIDPQYADYGDMERVSLAYQKIEWRHLPVSKSHIDDYRQTD